MRIWENLEKISKELDFELVEHLEFVFSTNSQGDESDANANHNINGIAFSTDKYTGVAGLGY